MSTWQAHKDGKCSKLTCYYCQHPPVRDPKRHPVAVRLIDPMGRLQRLVFVA